MIRRPPRSTLSSSSAASDVYKRQDIKEMLATRRKTKQDKRLSRQASPNPDHNPDPTPAPAGVGTLAPEVQPPSDASNETAAPAAERCNETAAPAEPPPNLSPDSRRESVKQRLKAEAEARVRKKLAERKSENNQPSPAIPPRPVEPASTIPAPQPASTIPAPQSASLPAPQEPPSQDPSLFFSSLLSCSPVSYTHLRAHETPEHLVCRLLLEKKKKKIKKNTQE
eukprot:TRINITY_DN27126_c0_g1_i1.p1 TRINITY_DN27126_c0_g1~~TRINITY_DN27126_c0_g1_i1.p1  ORF type:complete len:225 (+),score=58.74 TRINITY_DN27126_c0_g1_i1:115-789(+)